MEGHEIGITPGVACGSTVASIDEVLGEARGGAGTVIRGTAGLVRSFIIVLKQCMVGKGRGFIGQDSAPSF